MGRSCCGWWCGGWCSAGCACACAGSSARPAAPGAAACDRPSAAACAALRPLVDSSAVALPDEKGYVSNIFHKTLLYKKIKYLAQRFPNFLSTRRTSTVNILPRHPSKSIGDNGGTIPIDLRDLVPLSPIG